MSHKVAFWQALLLALGTALGCGGSSSAPPSQSPMAYEAPAGPGAAPGAPPAAESAPSYQGGEMEEAGGDAVASRSASEPPSRPGLGTAWGENVQSSVTEGVFMRANPAQPYTVVSLWYNDQQGATAMAGSYGYQPVDSAITPTLNGGLTVHLKGERGEVLPGFQASGKQYVIGEAGTRYIIVVRNYTGFRFEVVASVDGLDVIDGRPASFSKRGYILEGQRTLEIEGFRRSANEVAAFRFSSVRDSYASRSGKGDRNVGVIGVAFFHERGTTPVWSSHEVDRRHQAQPFPGQYAVPPPGTR